jgi:serine/threonine protein phosphatase PrpC
MTEETSLAQRITDGFLQLDTEAEFALGGALNESGCTATMVLQQGEGLLVASIGDTRAILGGIGGRCHRLTVDHSPAFPEERARIEAAGGTVSHKILCNQPHCNYRKSARMLETNRRILSLTHLHDVRFLNISTNLLFVLRPCSAGYMPFPCMEQVCS